MADPTLEDINHAISMQEEPSIKDVDSAIALMESPHGLKNDPYLEKRNLSGQVLSPNDFTRPGENIPKEGGLLNFAKYNISHFQPNNRNNLMAMGAAAGPMARASEVPTGLKINTDALRAKEPLFEETTTSSAADSPVKGLANLIKSGAAKVTGYFSHEGGLHPIIEEASSSPAAIKINANGTMSNPKPFTPSAANIKITPEGIVPAASGEATGGHGIVGHLIREAVGSHLGLPPGVATVVSKGSPMAMKALMKINNSLYPVFEAADQALPNAMIPASAAMASAKNQGDK